MNKPFHEENSRPKWFYSQILSRILEGPILQKNFQKVEIEHFQTNFEGSNTLNLTMTLTTTKKN